MIEKVNCLTVIMFNDAIERAKYLDAEYKKTGKVTGPLHGLPISLKDNFNVRGYPSSVGFSSWATEPMTTESTIVTTLRSLGAVFYVKTNVPTAMMIAESVNNTYGRCVKYLIREQAYHADKIKNYQSVKSRYHIGRLIGRRVCLGRSSRQPSRRRDRHRWLRPNPIGLYRPLHDQTLARPLPTIRRPECSRRTRSSSECKRSHCPKCSRLSLIRRKRLQYAAMVERS
jgi:hypothetical protein